MQSLTFLLSTFIDLYVFILLLRVWMQAARVDFYNPFSQFVVKVTQPVVAPLRRLIPGIGGWDIATLLLVVVIQIIKFPLIAVVQTGAAFWSSGYLLLGLLATVKAIGKMIFWVLLIRALLSWVSQGRSPMDYVLFQLTEPLLAPLRRILPPMGGLDLSVMLLSIILIALNYLGTDVFGFIWLQL